MIHPSLALIPSAILACAAGAAAAADQPTQPPIRNTALEIAFGAKVYAENCNRCHETPDPASRDGKTWRALSVHMRIFADLSRSEQQQVRAFLQSQNTPKKD